MKPFTIIDCDQRSDAWKLARLGRITGTCANAMLSEGRSAKAESTLRRDLKLRICCERLTGVPQPDDFKNRHTDYGQERESDAVLAYEVARDVLVRRTGFISHNTLPIGCSLDGHIGDFVGLVEFKCPKTSTHLTYLRDPKVPLDYLRQITHNLFVTGAEWCDFVSFDDRLGPELKLVIRRVRREDVDLHAYELALRLFLGEVDAELLAINALKGAA